MQINYYHLKAARLFCSDSNSMRTAIQGVHVDLVNKRLVATDGRRLAIVNSADMDMRQGDHDLSNGTEGFTLPAEFVDRILKPGKKKYPPLVTIDINENVAATMTDAGHLYTDLIQAKFPDYVQVLPPEDAIPLAVDFAHFNFDFLASFVKAIKILGGGTALSVRRYASATGNTPDGRLDDPQNAVFVIRNESSIHGSEFYGLLMPMRAPNNHVKPRPDWLTFGPPPLPTQ